MPGNAFIRGSAMQEEMRKIVQKLIFSMHEPSSKK
jgi:hypothetical protein